MKWLLHSPQQLPLFILHTLHSETFDFHDDVSTILTYFFPKSLKFQDL